MWNDANDVSYDIGKFRYLLKRKPAIALDTMILASSSADTAALDLLMQHDAETRETNQLGPQASPLHWLCSSHEVRYEFGKFLEILDLLIKAGFNINYRIRHQCSQSELHEEKEKFLWSQPWHYTTSLDRIEQAKAESHLEYAIIVGNENIALELVRRGCQFTRHEIKLAAKFGLLSLLKSLLNHEPWASDGECIRKTCLRLALRWGNETIVHFLFTQRVPFGEQDIIYALQYPWTSTLSVATQMNLIYVTPDMDRRKIFGLSSLELCSLKFKGDAVRQILRRYPAAYDSGALCATVLRSLHNPLAGPNGFHMADIQTMINRRTEHNRDWEKENTAVLLAAMLHGPAVVRALVTPGTACVLKTARLPKRNFSLFLDPRRQSLQYGWMDPSLILSCHVWVVCSPLMGIATRPDLNVAWSVAEVILDYLLECSYEPDALTVVVAASRGHIDLLRHFQRLKNWRHIVSIDTNDRPPWCPTALQVAASQGNEEIVQLLLDANVSVNELPANEPMANIPPRTALQAAIEKGSLDLADLFLQRGACINAPAGEDSGATALQLACIHGHLDMSARLLELGADVNASGALRRGRTALEGAAEHGRIDTIQLLLNHGASTDGPFRMQYLKAVLYAERNGHFAAASLLKQHREWTAEDEECYRNL